MGFPVAPPNVQQPTHLAATAMRALPAEPASQTAKADTTSFFDLRTTGTGVTSKRWSLVIACGLAAAAIFGCQQAEEIHHYQVPRPPRIRMLAAMIPHGQKVWFVKATGPDPGVEQHKNAFIGFLESFRFDDKANPPLTWVAPKDWKQDNAEIAKGGFKRFATFYLPAPEGDAVELTIFALPRQGMASDVLKNVNRWRKQLGLEEVTAEELKGLTRELNIGNTKATVVDMLGSGSYLIASRAPFAGAAVPKEKVAAGPPVKPTFKAPQGWQKAPRKPFSIATYRVGDGAKAVFITVTPAAGGLVANLNRWRTQVGLPAAADEEALLKDIRKLDLPDLPAIYVEYISPEGKDARSAICGAVPLRRDSLWFFKMSGPADAVIQQRAAFQEFLHSVRFPGGKEGHP